MRGVDLTRWRFDYDLTLAIVLAKVDGPIYARYGARENDGGTNHEKGLIATLDAALALHESLLLPEESAPETDRDRLDAQVRKASSRSILAQLERKKGKALAKRRVEDFDVPTVRRVKKGACIHCHQVHEAVQQVAIKKKRFDPRDFATRYPTPSSIGLRFDRKQLGVIAAVEADTLASRAGLRKGDRIAGVDGQSVLSIADFVWRLEQSGDASKLRVDFVRGGKRKVALVELADGWRRPTLSWRASMYSMPPSPGLWIQEASGLERAKLKIHKGSLALKVRGLFKAAVRKSGLRVGDVIVAVDGEVERRNPGQFHALLRLRHWKPGSRLELDVIRGRNKKKKRITVRF